jgi:IS30 family transposase
MKKIKTAWHHVTGAERREIRLHMDKGFNQAEVARMMGRSISTISDELTRKVKGVYDPEKADHKAYVARKYSKYQGMKVEDDDDLRHYVVAKLKLDWSPEQIAGRIRFVDTHLTRISTDGIYKFIHSCYGGPLLPYLRYYGKRKKGGGAKAAPLTDRNFIEKRPKHVGNRRRFGHWEADFIVSGKNGTGALLVFVERKTRYVLIFKLPDRKVATVNAILEKLLGAKLAVTSLTIDNDVCFRHHPQMSRILKAPIFFCHPYHSWEKGSVENMNKWIRQYVEKGSDISKYSGKEIQLAEDRLNGRPRKCLRFRTPSEAIERYRARKKEIASMIKVIGKQKTAAAALFGLRV